MTKTSGDTEFGASDKGVKKLAASLGGARSLADAFPAALVTPVWQALLEAGAVEMPKRVDAHRVEVLLVDPHQVELRVPVRSGSDEFVKVVPVRVDSWPASGELARQIGDEAERLARALEAADATSVVQHKPGQSQKPHN
jgi:hypothetical protein